MVRYGMLQAPDFGIHRNKNTANINVN